MEPRERGSERARHYKFICTIVAPARTCSIFLRCGRSLVRVQVGPPSFFRIHEIAPVVFASQGERTVLTRLTHRGYDGPMWTHMGPHGPMTTRDHVKAKRRIKPDLDRVVAEILDLIAVKIETELVPRPTRSALLEKAGYLFIDRWLALHPEDRDAVDAIKTKYSDPKKVLRLAKPVLRGTKSESRSLRTEGEEIR